MVAGILEVLPHVALRSWYVPGLLRWKFPKSSHEIFFSLDRQSVVLALSTLQTFLYLRTVQHIRVGVALAIPLHKIYIV